MFIYPQNLVYIQGYEVWDMINYRDVVPNMYAVSTFGRIQNTITGHILSQSVSNSGYLTVCLRCTGENNRKCGTFTVHRIMMATFHPITNMTSYTVNHHDCNKMNNEFFNLEWMTQKENNEYKYITNTDNNTGENNKSAVITEAQAIIICEELQKGAKYKDILNKIGLYPKDGNDNLYDLIGNIKRGISWKHISKNYNFSDIEYNHSNYTNEQIHYICQCLQDGIDIKEMYQTIHGDVYINSKVNKSFYETIRRIKNKQQFINISSNYNF